MTILIDGYNLLYAIKKVDSEYESLSDHELCQLIDAYLIRIKSKGEIVFDGRRRDQWQSGKVIKRLHISYSGYDSDADTVIENRISASTAPKLLVVVSSDRRVRDAAARRKAKVVLSDDFWGQLEATLGKKGKHKPEPESKQSGISDAETTQWMKFFDIDNE